MNSMERVLSALSHQEGDRVPLYLPLTIYGAKEFKMPIQKYFADPERVFEGQMHMMNKYEGDFVSAFNYASLETEAFGGGTYFVNEGPPNAAAPFISTLKDIENLQVPKPEESAPLLKMLRTTELLKAELGETVPIVGVAMSPFSLPIMQMGFGRYIELFYNESEAFELLMQKNIEFCINWSNAQLKAGATIICYFDPMSSPSIISPVDYNNWGSKIAKEVLGEIKGPTITHFASGRVLPILERLQETGTEVVSASILEDLQFLKEKVRGKIVVAGNLNAIEMCSWTPKQAEQKVRETIRAGAAGGGFVLTDNHGEIPFQVPEDVLLSISRAVKDYGNYPLNL
jgi:uroporphyrinogen decarboxylase